MKELFNILAKDINKEHFTTKEVLIYAIVAPVVFFLIGGFAEWLIK